VTPLFLVAAVGASAGGIQAFKTVLTTIPSDAALAIILIQHIARDFDSQLAAILSRYTDLKVVAATHGVRIEQGHVYVITPNTCMTVIDGHLLVHERPPGHINNCVNAMFVSMAEFYGNKSVAVILSGCLSDGSAGFARVQAAGGTTITQLPEDAEFESMPRSSMAMGHVSAVLTAQDIGTELVRLSLGSAFAQPSH